MARKRNNQEKKLKKRCMALVEEGQKLQAVKLYHEETGANMIESLQVIGAWEADFEKDALTFSVYRIQSVLKRSIVRPLIICAVLILIIFAISNIIQPEYFPAKIQEVYYTSNGTPVARTTPCYAFYLSAFEGNRVYKEGVSITFDKFPTGCRMICRSGLQTISYEHDYYDAWLDSLKYVRKLDKEEKKDNWVTFAGKYLTFYFENGDSLKLFPNNKKIFYDNIHHEVIYASYNVSQKCKRLLTQNNIVRMKMDDVFDHKKIRKELRKELKERFDLLDNYVLEPKDTKKY